MCKIIRRHEMFLCLYIQDFYLRHECVTEFIINNILIVCEEVLEGLVYGKIKWKRFVDLLILLRRRSMKKRCKLTMRNWKEYVNVL